MSRARLLAALLLSAAIIGGGVGIVYGLGITPGMAGGDDVGGTGVSGGMGDLAAMAADVPRLPPVFGYYDGQEVFFVHPEVSDPEIAAVLGGMMGSPVPTVAGLAEVPDAALSTVYVFTSGITPTEGPAGPLGFQPDVFDTAPGDEGYSPLRRLVEVDWADDVEPRLLTAVADITAAADAGEVDLSPTDVVVNAPLLTWPDGQR